MIDESIEKTAPEMGPGAVFLNLFNFFNTQVRDKIEICEQKEGKI